MRKKKRKNSLKLIKVISYLIFLIIIFNIAQNYELNDNYVENKINLIINNINVTKELKYDLFINEKNVIYMSKEDIENYFDKSIRYDKENSQIITTYGEKIAKLPLNENIIKMNSWNIDILSGAIKKDDIYYIPITSMEEIYELDIKYIEKEKVILLDSLTKKLVKADVSKRSNVKYKPSSLSKTMDKLEKADKVIVIEHLENNWTKIRTKNGRIGYVKTNIIQNEIRIREDLVLK